MKRLIALFLCLALVLTLSGCELETWLDALAGESSSSGETSESETPSSADASALSAETPRPGGLRLDLTEEEAAAAQFAASLVPGDPDAPMPFFSSFEALMVSEPALLVDWLCSAEGWLIMHSGVVRDVTALAAYDANETAAYPNARFYALSAAVLFLRARFGDDISVDWSYLAQYDARVLPNTGVLAIATAAASSAASSSEEAPAKTTLYSEAVGFESVEGGWRFQLAACSCTEDASGLTVADYRSGASIGTAPDQDALSDFVWSHLTDFSYLYVTVLQNADGSLYIAKVE